MQDFDDGPGGAIYQLKLNAFVRYCRKKYPDDFQDEFTYYNLGISDILQQIESESTPMATGMVGSEEQDQNLQDVSMAANRELEENPAENDNQEGNHSTRCHSARNQE